MTTQDTMEYYRHRERQARALAEEAVMPKVVALHREMADRYAVLALEAAVATSRRHALIPETRADGGVVPATEDGGTPVRRIVSVT